MRPSLRVRTYACVALVAALGACDAASGVEVQPLPPATRPSPEARAGLPELVGTWRFAGWEFPDSAAMAAAASSLIAPGAFLLNQRLDSISGRYTGEGVNVPVVGEARCDRRFALVALAGADQSRYVAGQFIRDTLWVELTSLPAAESWPAGTRAAWVRSAPAAPFLRYAGQSLAPPAVDTLPPAPAESAAVPGMMPPAPVETAPIGAPAPSAPMPSRPPVREPIGRPVEQPAAPPIERPAPQPTPESTRVRPPAQRPPRVLGVPVQPQPRPSEPSPTAPRPAAPQPVVPRPALPRPDTIVTPPPPEPR